MTSFRIVVFGSWKRSGKDWMFRINQRVHPYARFATAATFEELDCGLFKDFLSFMCIVSWKCFIELKSMIMILQSVFHPIHFFRFAHISTWLCKQDHKHFLVHRRGYSLTCYADNSGSCSLTLVTLRVWFRRRWITVVISLSLISAWMVLTLTPPQKNEVAAAKTTYGFAEIN